MGLLRARCDLDLTFRIGTSSAVRVGTLRKAAHVPIAHGDLLQGDLGGDGPLQQRHSSAVGVSVDVPTLRIVLLGVIVFYHRLSFRPMVASFDGIIAVLTSLV